MIDIVILGHKVWSSEILWTVDCTNDGSEAVTDECWNCTVYLFCTDSTGHHIVNTSGWTPRCGHRMSGWVGFCHNLCCFINCGRHKINEVLTIGTACNNLPSLHWLRKYCLSLLCTLQWWLSHTIEEYIFKFMGICSTPRMKRQGVAGCKAINPDTR